MANSPKVIELDFADVEVAQKQSTARVKSVPVYFTGLTIANVKCFREPQVLDFTDENDRPAQWSVILGENGVGKTTVLQSLAMLQPAQISPRESDETYFLPVPMQNPDVYKYVRSVFARDVSPERQSRVESSLYCGNKLTEVNGRGSRITSYGISGTDEGFTAIITAEKSALQQIGSLVCYGYGAARRASGVSLTRGSTSDSAASLYSDDVELLNAEEWLLQADYAASKPSRIQKRAAKRRDGILEVLVRLLPDVSAIRFVTPGAGEYKPAVEFRTSYGWVRSPGLSLGYRTMIGWMVDLASRMFDRYARSENPLAEPAVVLIDEIDLHLHPAWQRSLMSHLSDIFRNTQFIVTAHSPLVVQAVPNANVILLRRVGKQVVVDNELHSVRGWRVDQILTSDLFGLPSAREPDLDPLIEERESILKKPRLTDMDQHKLAELNRRIGNLPVGETSDDRKAMDLIRRIALAEAAG